MAERTMTRIHRKLDEYPPEAREMVDKLLADPHDDLHGYCGTFDAGRV